jgi:catechol 2,3-dioxygenase-like lactoylglutathione lyase family enzyme
MSFLQIIPALPVKNVTASLLFYRNQLGFTVTHEWDGFAILSCDAVVLHLWQAGDESWRNRAAKSVFPVESGAESFIAGTASCRIQVTDIEELHGRLQPMGILHPNAPLHDTVWGTREFAVLDPDRNLITFFERPASKN